MKSLLKNYIGFIVGLTFGASVATLTSYAIFYDPNSIAEILELEQCLIQEITE